MYALTVNDVDAQTYARISCIAAEEELPLGQVLHRLIQSALEKYPFRRKSDFSRFAGRWSAEDAKAFEAATQRTIDEEDWQGKIPTNDVWIGAFAKEHGAVVFSFDHHMKALLSQGVECVEIGEANHA